MKLLKSSILLIAILSNSLSYTLTTEEIAQIKQILINHLGHGRAMATFNDFCRGHDLNTMTRSRAAFVAGKACESTQDPQTLRDAHPFAIAGGLREALSKMFSAYSEIQRLFSQMPAASNISQSNISSYDKQLVDLASDLATEPSFYTIHTTKQLRLTEFKFSQLLTRIDNSRSPIPISFIEELSQEKDTVPTIERRDELSRAYVATVIARDNRFGTEALCDPISQLPIGKPRLFTDALHYWFMRNKDITLNQLPSANKDVTNDASLMLRKADAIAFILHFTKHPYGLFQTLSDDDRASYATEVATALEGIQAQESNGKIFYTLSAVRGYVNKILNSEIN